MSSIFFHIDVNSAFLSWTAVTRLAAGDSVDLRDIPSIIGGDREKRHGIVLAKSVPAKAFHIQTGEPIAHALEKCRNLTIAAPDHNMYREKSRQFINYLRTLTPDIEQVSIDECYMDFTSIADRFESPISAANLIKNTIRDTMGFTVNVGISDKKVLAKMASDFRKPDLVHTLFSNEIADKMWPLPISSLYMCGKSSVEELRKLEILTIGDLALANPDIICLHLKSHGRLLWEYANGIDNSRIESQPADAKGIGNSTTLSQDAADIEKVHEVLLTLSDSVAERLRKAESLAYMVSVEVKYNTFVKNSHQTTLERPTNSSNDIFKTACRLFEDLWDHTPVRLLGIRVSKLVTTDEPIQMSLFDFQLQDDSYKKNQKLDKALDSIREKYGSSAIIRGSMLNSNHKK